jgi:ribosomal protein S18 acetylase RimI-like enzyme
MTEPRDLDRLAARAFPAAIEAREGGWLLRASPGESPKRVNSAVPLGLPLDVDLVEAWYRERGIDPRIMVTPEEDLEALDAQLADRGWTVETPADILVGDPGTTLERLEGPPHQVVPTELTGPLRSPDQVVALGAADGAGRATAVLQDGWTLLLGLDVAPEARRQGVAAALVRAWARLSEGRALYLQVEKSNEPAQALYARAGFTRSHGYHYRRAAGGTRRA